MNERALNLVPIVVEQTARGERAYDIYSAAQAMLDGYGALVSGVLIGMSEALQGGSGTQKAASKSPKK